MGEKRGDLCFKNAKKGLRGADFKTFIFVKFFLENGMVMCYFNDRLFLKVKFIFNSTRARTLGQGVPASKQDLTGVDRRGGKNQKEDICPQ
jgi:hypothetical protein